MNRRPLWAGAWVLLATWLLVACAGLPPPPPTTPSHALSDPHHTALGREVATAMPKPGVSGFRLLATGDDAYGALVALADRAQRTLDLQYYLIRNDESSRAVMQRVHAAAERGVRVRLLLDDLNTAGQDAALLRLTQHPNIEVRLYNPFPSGRMSTVGRILASLTDVARINQRMHNKMFVADNALAVTGGRNLGDAYFVHSASSNFLDIDVLVGGPAVQQLSATFDAFWNHPMAYPATAIAQVPDPQANRAGASDQAHHAAQSSQADPITATTREATDIATTLVPAATGPALGGEPAGTVSADDAGTASQPHMLHSPAPGDRVIQSASAVGQALRAGRMPLVWAEATVLADAPEKIGPNPPARDETIADDVRSLLRSAQHEVLLISPYFVPGRRGVQLMSELVGRGVRVRVLTNSLSTTDAPVVHIGYSKYREPLLKQGVELFELRKELGQQSRRRIGSFGSSQASLHAKVLVIDRRVAMVGSMNMDPRSEKLNSEVGVVMRSGVLSQQLVQIFDDVADGAYRLSLDPDNGRLLWHTDDGISASVIGDEPEAKWWLRLGLTLLTPFAPEEML